MQAGDCLHMAKHYHTFLSVTTAPKWATTAVTAAAVTWRIPGQLWWNGLGVKIWIWRWWALSGKSHNTNPFHSNIYLNWFLCFITNNHGLTVTVGGPRHWITTIISWEVFYFSSSLISNQRKVLSTITASKYHIEFVMHADLFLNDSLLISGNLKTQIHLIIKLNITQNVFNNYIHNTFWVNYHELLTLCESK